MEQIIHLSYYKVKYHVIKSSSDSFKRIFSLNALVLKNDDKLE